MVRGDDAVAVAALVQALRGDRLMLAFPAGFKIYLAVEAGGHAQAV